MNGSKLTSAPEVTAYLLAHIGGIAATYLINPLIFAALAAAGYGLRIPLAALAMSVLMMFVVLLLFLVMRKMFGDQQS
jgi:hypothetical protein